MVIDCSQCVLLLRDALNDIFDMCDLTGNQLWSREEFRLYNLVTSDQEIDDAEWQVVEGLSVNSSYVTCSDHVLCKFVCWLILAFICSKKSILIVTLSV